MTQMYLNVTAIHTVFHFPLLTSHMRQIAHFPVFGGMFHIFSTCDRAINNKNVILLHVYSVTKYVVID